MLLGHGGAGTSEAIRSFAWVVGLLGKPAWLQSRSMARSTVIACRLRFLLLCIRH